MSSRAQSVAAAGGGYVWLTRLALGLLVATVCARATMMEAIREPFEPVPAETSAARPEEIQGAPRLAGPAASLGMSLLCCVPALLVLVRRALDGTYALRCSWSHAAMALLAVWTAAGAVRAGDRFAAMISAAGFIGALAVIWAAVQLVRSWVHMRLAAGAAAGVLAVYVAAGLDYRFSDLPALRQNFVENRDRILREQGLEPDSFAARQFERKVMAGDVGVFSASPNTYAAALGMLTLVVAGAVADRIARQEALSPHIAVAVLVPPALWLLWQTHSRAATGILILMGAALLAARWTADLFARHRRAVYGCGLAGVIALAAVVAVWGMRRGGFPEKSLTFRWYYWTGAARLTAVHPIGGVGPGNFGQHYLSVRLPQAAEEVQDPHNFIMRAFAELGIPGGVVCIIWLALLWWELAAPLPGAGGGARMSDAAGGADGPARRGAALAVGLAAAAMALNLAVSTDWSQAESWIILQVIWRVIWAALLAGAMAAVVLSARRECGPDAAPALWVGRAVLAGVGGFCMHAMVDFPMSETSALYLFALLAGASAGIRHGGGAACAGERGRAAQTTAGVRDRWMSRRAAVVSAACAGGLWCAAAALLWAPVVGAESAAAAGDAALRRGTLARAAHLYRAAWQALPMNADYAYRAARAAALGGIEAPGLNARDMLTEAIRANPHAVRYYLLRAAYELRRSAPDAAAVREAMEQAVRLDPCSVGIRLEYATALERLGDRAAAVEQYRRALLLDEALGADEPRRMPAEKRHQIERRMAEAGG